MTLETLKYYLMDMRARAPHIGSGLEVLAEGNTARIQDRMHPHTAALVNLEEDRIICRLGHNEILEAPQGLLFRNAVYDVDGGMFVFRTDQFGRVTRINVRLNDRLAGNPGPTGEEGFSDGDLMQGVGSFGRFCSPQEAVNLFRTIGTDTRRLVRSIEAAVSEEISHRDAFRLTWRTDVRYPAPSVTRPYEFRFRACLQAGPRARTRTMLDYSVRNETP